MRSAIVLKTKMPTVIKKSILAASLLVVLLGVMAAFSPKTQALSTYVWDNRKTVGVVPLRHAPEGTSLKTQLWMVEGTKFRMKCWTTHQNFTGNYTSNKWFYGQEHSRGSWGYVHSSYVVNQTSVGRC